MVTSLTDASTNAHIKALQQALDEHNSSADWLVIAHNDPSMIRALTSALSPKSAAVLQVSQDTWNLDGAEFSEAIEWALQETSVKHLVLVGHSLAGGSGSWAFVPEADRKASFSGFDRLLAGVQRNDRRLRDAKQRFAAQVHELLAIPVVHNRWAQEELSIDGLLYRAEAGVFLAYDLDRDEFQPLVEAV